MMDYETVKSKRPGTILARYNNNKEVWRVTTPVTTQHCVSCGVPLYKERCARHEDEGKVISFQCFKCFTEVDDRSQLIAKKYERAIRKLHVAKSIMRDCLLFINGEVYDSYNNQIRKAHDVKENAEKFINSIK